ncbi:MAG: DUF4293 domain-containing protein [Bacteroidetes bacterium]|nr:DUF4293 domain-containing protein [Fibrella sp.]
MIQRVQSIFLFLLALCMGFAVASPIWEKAGPKLPEMARLTAWQYSYQQGITTFVQPLWYLGGLLALIAIVALYAMFQYKNRLQQQALCAVNSLLLMIVMGLLLYRTLYLGKEYGNPADQGSFLPGFYAIIGALFANTLANRFIRRDEKLVKESNRFR